MLVTKENASPHTYIPNYFENFLLCKTRSFEKHYDNKWTVISKKIRNLRIFLSTDVIFKDMAKILIGSI